MESIPTLVSPSKEKDPRCVIIGDLPKLIAFRSIAMYGKLKSIARKADIPIDAEVTAYRIEKDYGKAMMLFYTRLHDALNAQRIKDPTSSAPELLLKLRKKEETVLLYHLLWRMNDLIAQVGDAK